MAEIEEPAGRPPADHRLAGASGCCQLPRPESVRAKVRADYRARLAQVVVQLGTHGDLIASTLGGRPGPGRRSSCSSRAEEFEVRAEAELRHTVGEYTDDEWQLVELESSGKIEGLDQELGRLSGEISRLEEVQALIMPAPARGASAPPAAASTEDIRSPTGRIEMPVMLDQEPLSVSDQPALTLVRDEGPLAPMTRPEAPRFVPRPGSPKSAGPRRAIPFPQSAAGQQQNSPAPRDRSMSWRSCARSPSILRRSKPQAAPRRAALNAPGPLDREDRAEPDGGADPEVW